MLIPPKSHKPFGIQLRIADCMLNVLVPQVMLNRARVLAIIGQLIPRGQGDHGAVLRRTAPPRRTCGEVQEVGFSPGKPAEPVEYRPARNGR